jgi:hypothetical protein
MAKKTKKVAKQKWNPSTGSYETVYVEVPDTSGGNDGGWGGPDGGSTNDSGGSSGGE